MKRKYVNKAPFMRNELKKINHEKNKTTMKRSRLKNNFLENKNKIYIKNYNVQKNYCKKLLKTTQEEYINDLNTSKVADNGTFWNTVVPLFTNKASRGEKVAPKEVNKNITKWC